MMVMIVMMTVILMMMVFMIMMVVIMLLMMMIWSCYPRYDDEQPGGEVIDVKIFQHVSSQSHLYTWVYHQSLIIQPKI